MPKVYNKKSFEIPEGAVYVGRPTKWGNPFVIGKDGTRDYIIKKYRQWLGPQIRDGHLNPQELAGKDLICWCAPEACHADVLLEIANEGLVESGDSEDPTVGTEGSEGDEVEGETEA